MTPPLDFFARCAPSPESRVSCWFCAHCRAVCGVDGVSACAHRLSADAIFSYIIGKSRVETPRRLSIFSPRALRAQRDISTHTRGRRPVQLRSAHTPPSALRRDWPSPRAGARPIPRGRSHTKTAGAAGGGGGGGGPPGGDGGGASRSSSSDSSSDSVSCDALAACFAARFSSRFAARSVHAHQQTSVSAPARERRSRHVHAQRQRTYVPLAHSTWRASARRTRWKAPALTMLATIAALALRGRRHVPVRAEPRICSSTCATLLAVCAPVVRVPAKQRAAARGEGRGRMLAKKMDERARMRSGSRGIEKIGAGHCFMRPTRRRGLVRGRASAGPHALTLGHLT